MKGNQMNRVITTLTFALSLLFTQNILATTEAEALSQSIAAFGWCFVAQAEKDSIMTPGESCVGRHLTNVSLILTMSDVDPDKADLWARSLAIEVQLYALGQTSYTAEADYVSACMWCQASWQTYAESYSNNTTAITKAQAACLGWREVHNALVGGDADFGASAIAVANCLSTRIDELNADIVIGINN